MYIPKQFYPQARNITMPGGSPKNLVLQNPDPCAGAPLGTQEQVFCKVQKFPRIVVLNQPYGRLSTIQVNQCIEVGKADQPCPCSFPRSSSLPLKYQNNKLVINTPVVNEPYNPNPPFPYVPKAEQIQCYNLSATLDSFNVNKRNFINNTNDYNNSLGTP